MGKRKVQRYDEVARLENVIDLSHFRPGMVHENRGKWGVELFGNKNPLVLELACGKGDYALGLAALEPKKNYIGIDIKGERLWVGAKKVQEEEIINVRFIRTMIDHITGIFAPGEIDEIWITFPDPFLKGRKENRRLTSPRFLEKYKKIVKPEACIHLKTDSQELYAYTLETLRETGVEIQDNRDDIYSETCIPPELSIQTYYEKRHLKEGRTIRFLKFRIH